MTNAGRSLSLFDLLCLGVNAIVGSGIYAFPGLLTGFLGPASFLAFVVAGSVSLLVAFCFAETAGGFERSGGPYVYARTAFGGGTGYIVGWTCWAAALISWAAVSRALLPYLAQLAKPLGTGATGTAAAVAIVALMATINYFGVKPGAITTDVLTIAKLLPLFVLTIVGFFKMRFARLSPFAPHGLDKLPRAAFIAFFAYQGFEVVPVPAGESKDPTRNVPLAVVGSLLGATALYVIVQIVAVATTPGLANAKQPLALMGSVLLGGFGGKLVAAAAVISMLGFCSGVALASPRYLEALAQDRFLPPLLARRHARWGTPTYAIALTSGVTAL
ncbi:MAG: amino acid permease, partial [Myxococcales bacterium]|nr:amino acid permease [Myxococcales bacterium]